MQHVLSVPHIRGNVSSSHITSSVSAGTQTPKPKDDNQEKVNKMIHGGMFQNQTELIREMKNKVPEVFKVYPNFEKILFNPNLQGISFHHSLLSAPSENEVVYALEGVFIAIREMQKLLPENQIKLVSA